MPDHEFWMNMAVNDAKRAEHEGERPFGCVIIDQDEQLICRSRGTGDDLDPTRHSEMVAIREACKSLGRLLHGCTLYSTHEPCIMCTGAILHSKVSTVVWGSYRADLPALFRPYNIQAIMRFGDTSHPPKLVRGVLQERCVRLFDKEVAHVSYERARNPI